MRTKGIVLLFIAAAMMMEGCARVHEPWDTRDYFKQERTRSPEQEKLLRERALQGETDRHMGIQQVNRTS